MKSSSLILALSFAFALGGCNHKPKTPPSPEVRGESATPSPTATPEKLDEKLGSHDALQADKSVTMPPTGALGTPSPMPTPSATP